MSFLKISDPAKRDAIVKEYLDLRRNIRNNLLSERTGEMEAQSELTKFLNLLLKHKKLLLRRLQKNLNLLKKE